MNALERVAVITGAAQGIGRRTAEVLAERGCRLALIDLRDPDDTVQSIQARGGDAMSYAGDITREETIADFARQVFARFGSRRRGGQQCRHQPHLSRRRDVL